MPGFRQTRPNNEGDIMKKQDSTAHIVRIPDHGGSNTVVCLQTNGIEGGVLSVSLDGVSYSIQINRETAAVVERAITATMLLAKEGKHDDIWI